VVKRISVSPCKSTIGPGKGHICQARGVGEPAGEGGRKRGVSGAPLKCKNIPCGGDEGEVAERRTQKKGQRWATEGKEISPAHLRGGVKLWPDKTKGRGRQRKITEGKKEGKRYNVENERTGGELEFWFKSLKKGGEDRTSGQRGIKKTDQRGGGEQ